MTGIVLVGFMGTGKTAVGNELANRFYQEGDAMKALDVYLTLASLDSAPEWQLPVWYQIGLVFEHLSQPAKAIEYYTNISGREKEVGASTSPSLKSLLEMARWRKDFLAWQLKAEAANVQFRAMMLGSLTTTNSL